MEIGPPWTEKYAPTLVDALNIHKGKIAEVEEALRNLKDRMHQMPQLLVISGPAGSGKSSCISCLTNALSLEVIEWINPSNLSLNKTRKYSGSPWPPGSFQEFLLRGTRLPALELIPLSSSSSVLTQRSIAKKTQGGKVLLVEDLPNLSTPAARRDFHATLSSYLSIPAPSTSVSHGPYYPLILVVTNSTQSISSLSTSPLVEEEIRNLSSLHLHQVVPLDILSHPSCHHIR